MMLLRKEIREAAGPAGMALLVMLVLFVAPALTDGAVETAALMRRIGSFIPGATAVLFFLAVVLGVMAFAGESEAGTLEVLYARPVSAAEIFRAKVTGRLGLQMILVLCFGLLLLLPAVVWKTDGLAPMRYLQAWVSAISLSTLGFALGLWFGMRHAHQTAALVYALLSFAALWIVLNLTPLAFSFDPIGWTWTWLYTFVPLAAGLLLLAASARVRPSEQAPASPRRWAVGAFVVYGLALAALTWLSTGQITLGPQRYLERLTLRAGSPEKVLEIVERNAEERYRLYATELPEILMGRFALSMAKEADYPDPMISNPYMRTSPFYSLYVPVLSTPDPRYFEDLDYLADHRSTAWFAELLSLAADAARPLTQRLLALYATGVTNDDAHTERLVELATDPAPEVRVLAGMLLLARGDRRGAAPFAAALPETEVYIPSYMVQFALAAGLDARLDSTFRSWLTSDSSARIRAALSWLMHRGSMQDEGEVRAALLRLAARQDREWNPHDTSEFWDIQLMWADANDIPRLRREADAIVAELTARREEFDAVYAGVGSKPISDVRLIGEYQSLVRRLGETVWRLAELGDPQTIDTWFGWNRDLSGSYEGNRFLSAQFFLPHLARLGERGLDMVERFLEREELSGMTGRQTALYLLVYYGRRDHMHELYRRWRGSCLVEPEYSGFPVRNWEYPMEDLIRRGHAVLAGPVIEAAWRELQARGKQPGGEGEQDAPYASIFSRQIYQLWTVDMADAIGTATGERYGWDIQAWYRWWQDNRDELLAEAGIVASAIPSMPDVNGPEEAGGR